VFIVNLNPLLIFIVASLVPEIFRSSNVPISSVFVGKVQLVQLNSDIFIFTASVALPALVISPLSFPPVHVSISSDSVPSHAAEVFDVTVNSMPVPNGHFCPAGHGEVFVEQRTVAEAVPAPTNAIRAMAATAAMPRIFTYFIFFSLFIPAQAPVLSAEEK